MVNQIVSTAVGDVLPVTILTGFLGAGKTTVLAALLREPAFAQTAVIINEFGEIGLDHELVRANTDARIVLLESGCVCCSLRSDLTDTLRELFRQRVLLKIPEFTRVIVETTGLADPLPILNALQADPVTAVRFRLDGIVTVVDAVNGDSQLDIHPEAVRQAALADRIILSKTDLATAEGIVRIRARLAQINPGATPIAARFGAVPPEELLGDPPAAWRESADATAHEAHHHDHNHGIESFVITMTRPLAWDRLAAGLENLLAAHGDRILRLKGLLQIVGETQPVVIHGVGHMLYPPGTLPDWPGPVPASKLIFITENLSKNEVEAALEASLI